MDYVGGYKEAIIRVRESLQDRLDGNDDGGVDDEITRLVDAIVAKSIHLYTKGEPY